MNDGTADSTPDPEPLPLPAAAPPWTLASTGGAAVPPPPPPPPPPPGFAAWTPMWMPEPAPPLRARSRRAVAGALVGIFAVGIAAGVVAARWTAPAATPGAVSLAPSGSGTGNGGAGTSPTTGDGGGTPGTPADTSGVAAKVTPGIVNINVTVTGGGAAAGTGMVITSTGQVLTNNHVIDGESSVSVELPSTGKTYSAHVLGWSPTDDVALLQIDGGSSFSTVSVGDSSAVTVGQSVVALGNALGRNGAPSVTSGNVTALNRTITASDQGGGNAETVSGLIQVDAQIQPGDSGGPLATSSGTVIGMNTAAQTGGTRFGQGSSTAAFAIPINHAIAVVQQIQSGKATSAVHLGDTRALLGVGAQDSAGGVKVQTVQSGSGAAGAGITVGSVISALDGTSVSTNSELRAAILTHKPGDTVTVTWTDPAGAGHTAKVTLSSGPPA